MKVENLITLIAILFIFYFFFVDRKEHLTIEEEKTKNKACSQISINSGFLDYTFGGKKFIR